MKKAICLTLAALALSAALTGCSGMNDPSNVSTRRDGVVNGTEDQGLTGENGIIDNITDRM